jgi:hypothetical protein
VGIYFVTQSPGDIPDGVLAQLSNRVQHALRAYTPAEQKAVRTAAQTMRPNPKLKTEDVIMELGVGEALTSFLDEEGVPGMVQRTSVICPQSLMAPTDEETRRLLMSRDGMSKYDISVDPLSAYEELTGDYPEDTSEPVPGTSAPAYDADTVSADSVYEREDGYEDRESAVKRRQRAWEAEKKAKEEAEAQAAREARERAEAEERKKADRETESQRKKKEKEAENARKKKEKAAERRKAQIERQLINTGMQVLKRGLMNTLFK